MSDPKVKPTICSSCHSNLEQIGEIPFRIKGETGLAKFFLGDVGELGEEAMKLDLYRCATCGHIDLFDLDFSLKKN